MIAVGFVVGVLIGLEPLLFGWPSGSRRLQAVAIGFPLAAGCVVALLVYAAGRWS